MRADPFTDRREAGQALARLLGLESLRGDVLVLGLPRGGVPVAAEVAAALGAPLDVLVVRKLGVPGHDEYAFGAIASGGARVLHADTVRALGLDAATIERVAAQQQRELERRERRFRGDRPPPEVRGRTVVLVDDGLATGATMGAAVQALRAREPARLVVAVPVGAASSCQALRRQADQVVCAMTPEPFRSVGEWYLDFAQTGDDEVAALLQR